MSLSSNDSIQHPPFGAAIAQFEDQISRDVEKDGIGSITAAVVMENDEIWAKGFGWADTQRQIPADTQTIYRVGSIAKSFRCGSFATPPWRSESAGLVSWASGVCIGEGEGCNCRAIASYTGM